jgi:PilZ domain
LNDSRSTFRYKTDRQALITLMDGGSIPCRVLDTSTRGARLEMSEPKKMPEEFFLIIHGQGERYRCQVVWQKGTMIGVQYF